MEIQWRYHAYTMEKRLRKGPSLMMDFRTDVLCNNTKGELQGHAVCKEGEGFRFDCAALRSQIITLMKADR